MHKLPYAEDINYWQTGKSAPDAWIEKAKREIAHIGGKIVGEAFGKDAITGRAAYMLQFILDNEPFKIVWPVLPTRGGREQAARIQAATLLYHDVKARCMAAAVLGKRAAFFSFLALPDGRTMADVATPELASALPDMFRPRGLIASNEADQ